MSESDVSELIAKLKSFPIPADKTQRQRLWEATQSFAASIEDESNLQHRLLSAPLQLVIPRIASDLKVFDVLVSQDQPLSTDELVEKTNADEMLLKRILRYLETQSFIASTPDLRWARSRLTSFLANPAYSAALRFGTSCILSPCVTLPAYLSQRLYRDFSHFDFTAFQAANASSESLFEWLAARPDDQQDFDTWMAESHRRQKSAFDVFSLEEYMRETTADTPIFVDVGGGNGRSCLEFRMKSPSSVGKVINQDKQAKVVGLQSNVIEHMEHSFFSAQPIRGARVYHIRNVLHNWSDEQCIQILKNICVAMSDQSIILVDTIVMDEKSISRHASYVDLVMGIFFGSRERTMEGYVKIFEEAGLVIRHAQQYMDQSGEHVMALVPKL